MFSDLIVVAGYPSSPYLVRPFDANELAREESAHRRERMTQFNYELSRVRVRVEQAYGRLKGRFPSLKVCTKYSSAS